MINNQCVYCIYFCGLNPSNCYETLVRKNDFGQSREIFYRPFPVGPAREFFLYIYSYTFHPIGTKFW